MTIPIIDEALLPFRAPPPRKIDLLSTCEFSREDLGEQGQADTAMVDLPDDVEAPTVRRIMDII